MRNIWLGAVALLALSAGAASAQNVGKFIGADGVAHWITPSDPLPVGPSAPATGTGLASTPAAITAAASSQVVCSAACSLYGFQLNTGATAGMVMLLDATAAPTTGASVTPRKVWQVAANSTFAVDLTQAGQPLAMTTGAVLLFSSNASPLTFTASATAYFSAEKK